MALEASLSSLVKLFILKSPYLSARVSNNVLEYLAEIVAIWVSILDGKVQPSDCCFLCTDNTTTISWIFKSNFSDYTYQEKEDTDSLSREEVSPHLTLS